MKTIRRIASERGISVQAVYKRLRARAIKPKRDKLTGWRMLTAAQERQLDKPHRP